MPGFVTNIEQVTIDNTNFRQVLYTAKNSQLVVMSLAAGEDIGEETHHLDQFIKVEQGQGVVMLNGQEFGLEAGYAVVIPAGTKHNVINDSDQQLKLYTLYSPPEHKDKAVYATKQEAITAEESGDDEYDGNTSEVL